MPVQRQKRRAKKGCESNRRRRTAITVAITRQYKSRQVRIRPLRELVRFVLHAEGVNKARISVALVDDETLQRLHGEFLGDDRPSDVMSFRLDEQRGPTEIEVVISLERAEQEGPRHGLSAEQETWLYLIHALLHQCGYDDRHPADRSTMWRRQQELLEQFCQRKL